MVAARKVFTSMSWFRLDGIRVGRDRRSRLGA
jgi:hypothetical protein